MAYTISEAAERFGLSAHTLRFYDKQGLLPFVARNAAGVRVFEERDLGWLTTITCLKKTGMPIKQIKEFIDWSLEGDATIEQRLHFLLEHKKAVELQMAELEGFMEHIDHKIWYYAEAAEAGTLEVHNKKSIAG